MKRSTDTIGIFAQWAAWAVTGAMLTAGPALACRDNEAAGTAHAGGSTSVVAASAGMGVLSNDDGQAPDSSETPRWAPQATPAPPAPRAPRARAWRGYSYTMPFAVPTTPAPPVAPAPPAEMAPSRVLPRGWFGFAFQCESCSATRDPGDSVAVWVFGSRPRVYLVTDDGPAARGGIQRGDVITAIDGVSILSEEGGRRFATTRPGQVVRWTLLRDGVVRHAITVAAVRPEAQAQEKRRQAAEDFRRELGRLQEMSDLRQMRAEVERLNQRINQLKFETPDQAPQPSRPRVRTAKPLRYAGMVGGTEVEVRGNNPVIVSEGENKNEIIINAGESVVVIRVPDGSTAKIEKIEKKKDR